MERQRSPKGVNILARNCMACQGRAGLTILIIGSLYFRVLSPTFCSLPCPRWRPSRKRRNSKALLYFPWDGLAVLIAISRRTPVEKYDPQHPTEESTILPTPLNVLLVFSPSSLAGKDFLCAFRSVSRDADVTGKQDTIIQLDAAKSSEDLKRLCAKVQITSVELPLYNESPAFLVEKAKMGVDLCILCLEKGSMGEKLTAALAHCKALKDARVDGAEVESEGKSQGKPSAHRIPISVVFIRKLPSWSAHHALPLDIDSDTDKWWGENKSKFHAYGVFPHGVLCVPSVSGRHGAPLKVVRGYLECLIADQALRLPPIPRIPEQSPPVSRGWSLKSFFGFK